MANRLTILSTVIYALALGSTALAASQPIWPTMPPACTPARMQRWIDGYDEKSQYPCHCPPSEMCPQNPQTGAEFVNNVNLPPNVTIKCCTIPTCPEGTKLEGQYLPMDGNCDAEPPKCPWGTEKITVSGGYRNPANAGNLLFTNVGFIDAQDVCGTVCTGTTSPVIYIMDDGQWSTITAAQQLKSRWIAEAVPFGEFTYNYRNYAVVCEEPVRLSDCLHGASTVILGNGKTAPVKTLKSGDFIQGPTGKVRVEAVSQIDHGVTFYRLNDLQLRLTSEHPVQTTTGWKSVSPTGKYGDDIGQLKLGDVLVTAKGEVKLTKITPELAKKNTYAVNVRTENDEAFYVDGVAVKPFKDVTFSY